MFAWKIEFAFMESCWRNARLVATVCKDPLKEVAWKKEKSVCNWRGEQVMFDKGTEVD